jgi:uncharacterized membrane protein
MFVMPGQGRGHELGGSKATSYRKRGIMYDQLVQLARHLLDNGLAGLSEREQRVISLIAKRSHTARNVNNLVEEQQTFGDGLADRIAQLGGSWAFILVFAGMLMAWVVMNTVVLTRFGGGFDPYPYIFLNLILSMVAAFQAPVILMSQNRQAARDRLAAGLDYEINLKAEIEIMALHEKVDRIRLERVEAALVSLTRHCDDMRKMLLAKKGSCCRHLGGVIQFGDQCGRAARMRSRIAERRIQRLCEHRSWSAP